MVASVRVAGAHVDFSANANPYQQGVNRAIAANRQFGRSFAGIGGQLDRFRASLTSSLVATAAYAAGVGAVGRAIGGSSREFLAYEQGLIGVQKTAGLTNEETERLGRGIRELTTDVSLLGGPLPVARQNLQDIAVVAGQMNIRGTRDILAFTETVGLLGLTTDLVGDQAANAIGKIIATTSTGVDEVLSLGSALTALGNAFRGGEADIISQAQFLATQTAAFNLPTQDVLAYSAALAAGGQRAETAGTAFQRLFQSLTDAAAEAAAGDFERLGVIVQNLGDEVGTVEEQVDDLRRAIQSGDYRRGLLDFLTALQRAGPEGAGGIFTTLFGGETPPTRLAGIFGFLAQNLDEVNRAIQTSNASWEEQIALLEEAGLFAEARSARLLVVQNQLRDQGIAIGDALTAAFLPIAENFQLLEIGALSLASALAVGFGQRRINAIRETARQTRTAAISSRREAQQALLASKLRLQSIGLELAAFQGTERQRERLQRRRVRTEQRVTRARQTLAAANAQIAATSTRAARASALLGRTLSFLGGPLGLVVGALTAGAVAWQIFGDAGDDAVERLLERGRDLARQQRDESLAVTATGAIGQDIQAQLDDLRELLDRQRAEFETAIQRSSEDNISGVIQAFRPGINATLGDIRELEELATELGLEYDNTGDLIIATQARIVRSFEPLNTTFIQARQQVQAFRDQLSDAVSDATLRARLSTFTEADDPGPTLRRFRDLQDEQTLVVLNEVRRRERAVRDAQLAEIQLVEDLGVARRAIEDQGLTFGTQAAEQAEQQVRAIERQLVAARQKSETEREGLALAIERLRIDRESLQAQAEAERAAELARRLAQQSVARPGDATADRRTIEAELEGLRNRVEDERRRARQQSEIATLDERGGRALQARYQIENALADENRDVIQRLAAAKVELQDAEQREFSLLARLAEARDRDRDAIVEAVLNARQRAAAAREEIDSANNLIAALGQLGPQYQELARLAEQYANSANDARLAQQFFAAPVDTSAQQRIIEAQLQNAQNRAQDAQRQARQELELERVSERAAAGLRVRYELENELADTTRETVQRLAMARVANEDAVRREQELFAQLATAQGQYRDRILELIVAERQRVASTQEEIQNAEALLAAIQNNTAAFDDFITAQQRLAEISFESPLQRLARDTDILDRNFEDLVAGSLTNFEDALLNVFEEGRVSVGDLAKAIAVDLVQALIRARVTANLARAAFQFFGFGSPLAGLSFPSGSLGHTGGIVGRRGIGRNPRRSMGLPLKRGERYAILEDDEEVLTRGDPRHRWNIFGQSVASLRAWTARLPRYHEGGVVGGGRGYGGGGGQMMPVRVEVSNEFGPQAQVEDNGSRVDGETLVVGLAIRNIARRGDLYKAISNMR